MSDERSDDRNPHRFTWARDSVQFEKDPSLPPVATKEERAAFRAALDRWLADHPEDDDYGA